jgi:hypothetical protein
MFTRVGDEFWEWDPIYSLMDLNFANLNNHWSFITNDGQVRVKWNDKRLSQLWPDQHGLW